MDKKLTPAVIGEELSGFEQGRIGEAGAGGPAPAAWLQEVRAVLGCRRRDGHDSADHRGRQAARGTGRIVVRFSDFGTDTSVPIVGRHHVQVAINT